MNKIQKRRKAQKKVNSKRHAQIKRDKGKAHLAWMLQNRDCKGIGCYDCLIYKQYNSKPLHSISKEVKATRETLEIAERVYADRFSKEDVMSWIL